MAVTKSKRIGARTETAGRFLTAGFAESLNRNLGRKITAREIDAHGLLRGLANAVRKAEQSGKPVEVSFVVDPKQGLPKIEVKEVLPASNTLDSVLLAAKQRGAARVVDILSGEEMLSADAFAEEIGATRETVNNKRRRHEVLGLEGPKRGIRFPKWQLSNSGELLPNLPQLFDALGGHPWAVYRFLLMKHPELDGKRGLDALRAGRISDVIGVAKSIGSGAFA